MNDSKLLDKKSRHILRKVLQNPATLQQLSEACKVSPRTIRYGLKAIDDLLKDNNLPALSRKGGISFVGGEEERAKLATLIKASASQDYLPENRMNQIIAILLCAKGYTTNEEIAKRLDVSKNTVINDLGKLRSFYPYKSAAIEAIPRHGVRYCGNEVDIRESVISYMLKKSGINDVLFEQAEDRFAYCLQNIAKSFDTSLPDNAYIHLLLYLTVASIRIKSGYLIEAIADKEVSADFRAAAKMAIEEIIPDIASRGEYEYLAGLMSGYFAGCSNNRAEVQILLLNFVNNVEHLLDLDLMQDTEFLKTIDNDIQALVEKKDLFLPTYRDIEWALIEHCPDVYEAVRESVCIIEEHIGRTISKDELTPLVIPFAEAAQRKRTMSAKPVNILVVCNAGHSTSRMLCYQLLSMFDVNIVDAIALNQLGANVWHNNVDLIVSTVPLPHAESSYVLVNPFLTQKDLDALKKLLPTKVIDHNTFDRLIKAVEANCEVRNPSGLAEDIAEILGIKDIRRIEENLNLCDMLPSENIILDVHCGNWQQAVEQAGVVLLDGGYIEENYIAEMLKNMEQNGPYIVVAKGVAMPHAGLNFVNRAGMCLLRLSEPVQFGNAYNDPVDLVFGLCTTSKVVHLKALKQFSYLIRDKGMLEKIRNAKHVDEVVSALY